MKYTIEVKNLTNKFGDTIVHKNLDFAVMPGEICAIVGESGSGKTTLLRTILRLQRPYSGEINVLGNSLLNVSNKEIVKLEERWGVLFQHGALFSSLTVLENICFPIKEFTGLSALACVEIAFLRLKQVGLKAHAAHLYPAELSGGMVKRVALARALALEPELLFLDEPTAGLDPNSADNLEELILYLRDSLNLTIVLITHDLDTLWHVADRVAFIGRGRILANLPMNELINVQENEIQLYFGGKRSKRHYQID
ncbi:MAG: ATP-binding cassette domain-containing protein [Legionellales bacterium]|nr:ATP-binding cassette domain-containing protein [Legionellales bacterium]